jgi:cytochrome c553
MSAVLALSSLAAIAQTPGEGDISRGLDASKICVACHGQRGISEQDNYPHLHGQHRTYLLREMRAFRDGTRHDPIMSPMLANLSDQDLIDIAAYYASFNTILGSETPIAPTTRGPMPTPATTTAAEQIPMATDSAQPAMATAGDPQTGLTKAIRCRACHGADGRGTAPNHPNLNGQHADYLAAQLRAFRDGHRKDSIMTNLARPLSDQDILDIAAFYAVQK